MRIAKTAVAIAVLGSVLFSGAAAFGQASPTSGTLKVWGTANLQGGGATSPVLLTGVIAAKGKAVSVSASGKTDKNGNYTRIVLAKGTFLVNSTQFNNGFNTTSAPPDYNSTTCSASITFTAPNPIVAGKGTGAYVGITGSVNLTIQAAFILPKTKSGSCNTSNNANPVGSFGVITGSGTVTFG